MGGWSGVGWVGVVWGWCVWGGEGRWGWGWWWYDVCVSPYASTKHAPSLGARLPGRNSQRPRHPFPALMAGVNPGPVPVHRALPSTASKRHAVSVTTALGTRTTRTTGASTTRKSTACRSLHGLPNKKNHGKRPLHHDRDVDDQHALHNRASNTV